MGRNWAITIGINGYHNLQPLIYAKRDAEAVQAFLQRELQIQTPYHFTDDSPAIAQDYGPPLNSRPTYATLRQFFRIRFEEPFLKPGDNAIEGIERLARVSATPVLPAEPEEPVPAPQTGQPDAVPPKPAKPAIPTFKFEVITVDAQGREANRRPGEAEYWVEELGNGVHWRWYRFQGDRFRWVRL